MSDPVLTGLTPRIPTEALVPSKVKRVISTPLSSLVPRVQQLVVNDLPSIQEIFSLNQSDLEHAEVSMKEVRILQQLLTTGLNRLSDIRKSVAKDLETGRKRLKSERQK
jgi:hypothetical protein